ncbi:AzlD family protein [Agrobacterium sp. a22-2]|uniref:AzlD family protein n=1 Tax=Agrobacterium sp. a22-2 TaxID=2283840 RepID=UPI0014450B4C|nr:AzlD family protein [Agrobacterium sp. a22-2]NKN36236.1 AzlD family protein [Agrobacterium sp. a22-2]
MSEFFTPQMTLLILMSAVATYVTRIGGYLLISRLNAMPPRLEAALNAVPAAVLTTLVAPAFFAGGTDVKLAMTAALLVGLRLSAIPMLIIGWIVVLAARYFIG